MASPQRRVKDAAKTAWRTGSRAALGVVSSERVLNGASQLLQQLRYDVDGRRRQLAARRDPVVRPEIVDWTGSEPLRRSVLERDAPWLRLDLAPQRVESPSMIGDEEKRYYVYLGRFYAGDGAVVELGPWLGASTARIVEGLGTNPKFDGGRVAVFDDFVWRSSWMDAHLPPDIDAPADGASFRPLFERFATPYLDRLDVQTRRIGTPDAGSAAGDSAPPLTWEGGPIEMAFVDCGRTFDVNEAWYRVLSPHFLADRTLVVMQDWHTHRQVPARWYNQIKEFTDSLGPTFDLVHEVTVGGVATFLYRG